jgi:nucleotide-binding universal stress UspA family protein
MKSILVGIDFSSATPSLLKVAIELACASSAKLCLLHVIEPEPSMGAYGFSPEELPVMATFQNETRTRAKLRISELLAEVQLQIPHATSLVIDGNPLLCLIDQCREIGADFIIIGSHGHGIIASILLGSVAEALVRRAIVPTLVVPVGNR